MRFQPCGASALSRFAVPVGTGNALQYKNSVQGLGHCWCRVDGVIAWKGP